MVGRWGGIELEIFIKKKIFNIVCIFKFCNFKSIFYVLFYIIRSVNRECINVCGKFNVFEEDGSY